MSDTILIAPLPPSRSLESDPSPVLHETLLPIPTAQEVIAIPGLPFDPPPAPLARIGEAARHAWGEFFLGLHANSHTRAAYARAVRRFCGWLEEKRISLAQASPALIGHYFDSHTGSIPTQKLHLAALRGFFDHLVTRHVLILNAAATVRGKRYSVVEGKTPEISRDQARKLLDSIPTTDPLGLRDRAILGVLVYTAARAGAVARLRCSDLVHDGTQSLLRFLDKGGKSREIPVRHDLERMLGDYLLTLEDPAPDSPLFRTAAGRTGRWTGNAVTGVDVCRLVKRRLARANLPSRLSPHSFRVAVVTDLLQQRVPLDDVQHLAGHADPRTTRLYDRRQRRVTRNIVERISL